MATEYRLSYTASEINTKLGQIDDLSTNKLDASELNSAIESALATAKTSGEFDGEKGADGINGKSISAWRAHSLHPKMTNYDLDIGDLYLVTDTAIVSDDFSTTKGDIYLATATNKLVLQCNINGEQGDKGDTGATGAAGKSAYELAVENGFNGSVTEWLASLVGATGAKGDKGEKGDPYILTETDKAEITNDVASVCVAKNQGAANVGKILVVGTDGNLTLTDMPEGGASGDIIGTLDESNNILLTGNLADGTYTLKYENTDGTYTEVGTLEVGEIVAEPTNLFVIGGDGYILNGRCSSTGDDRTGNNGFIVSNYIDIKNGDTVYVKNTIVSNKTNCYSGMKLTDGSTIGLYPNNSEYITNYSESNGITQFTINKADADFLRITLEIGEGRNLTNEVVAGEGITITVNEPLS